MATSGSEKKLVYTTGNFIYKFYVYLLFDWSRKSYSIKDNCSVITWNAKVLIERTGLNIDVDLFDTDVTWKITIDKYVTTANTNINTVAGTYNIASGDTTIYHNADGTKSFNIDIRSDEWFLTTTGTLDTLLRPGTITSAPNFTDEESPTISYYNPSGSAVTSLEMCIITGDNYEVVEYRDIPKVSGNGTYTFNFTTDELRDMYYATIPDPDENVSVGGLPVKFQIRTLIEGTYYYHSVSRSMSLVNFLPTFDFTVVDTYSPTVELTGDNTKFVKYFSNATFDTGAKAYKDASIVFQNITCGSTILEDYTSNTGTIEGIDSNTFYLYAQDSRNNLVRDFKVVDLVPYIKLTSALTTQPLTKSGELSIIIEGNWFNGSFGAQDNTLQFEYLLEVDGRIVSGGSGDGSGWVIINPSVTHNGNAYEARYTITGLDPELTYNVTANAIDALMSVQTNSESVASTPLFDWSKNDFRFNLPVYMTKNLPIRTIDNNGNDVPVLNPCNINGDIELGGYRVGQKVLWEGASHMNGGQSAPLSEPVSAQLNGIVLVFSLFTDGVAGDSSIHSFFVSKKEVELLPGKPHTFFLMINSGFSVIGAKYIYIYDDTLEGNATNTSNSANNGITFNNSRFVLRYVIGV